MEVPTFLSERPSVEMERTSTSDARRAPFREKTLYDE